MNVRLTPQQEKFVSRQIAEGRYLSASEVIREGLRVLEDEMKWKSEVRKKITVGLEQLRRGEGVDGEVAVDRVLAKLKKAHKTKRKG